MAFAAHSDVATRLGRDLTSKEQSQATAVIATVEGLIAEAVGRDTNWAAGLSPVPATLKTLCVEKAVLAIVNPHAVASQTESLGEYSRAEVFPRSSDVGIQLSHDEGMRCRAAVYGSNVAAPRVGGILDDVYPYGS